MSRDRIERVKKELKEIAGKKCLELDEILVFGSRTREDYGKHSDIDMILVLEDFEGTGRVERPVAFYSNWPYGELPEPELISLTPGNTGAKRRAGNIVKTAAEEGVKLA